MLDSSTNVRLCATQRGQCFIAGHRDFRVSVSPHLAQLTHLVPGESVGQTVLMLRAQASPAVAGLRATARA